MSKGRCSPTEALALLAPAFAPMEAAAKLTQAIHSGTCHPYCKGVVIRSNLAPRLMVVAQPGNDGRWTAHIENTSYAVEQPVDVWEFEIDEVRALLPQAREGQSKPGSADAWIDHVCPNGEWSLMTAKAIHNKIVAVAEKLGVTAPSYSAVAAALQKRQT
jgi:hypothetical protein